MSALHTVRVIVGAACLLTPGLALAQAAVVPQQQVQPPADAGNTFGTTVAVSDSVLVVGAPGRIPSGGAYVYEWRSGRWALVADLRPAELLPFDAFGASVAVDGETVVVGAPGDDTVRDANGAVTQTISNKGAAYVFRRTASGWMQEARLDQYGVNGGGSAYLPGAGVDDAFGTVVAIEHDLLAVGMPGYDNPGGGQSFPDSGAVMVHQRIYGRWLVTGGAASRDYLGVPHTGVRFGSGVAIGDGVMAGAPTTTFNTRLVRRIVRVPDLTPTNWYAEADIPAYFRHAFPPQDGQGFRASLGVVTALLPSANGVLMVTDSHVRTVSDAGVVTTLQPLPVAFERLFFDSPTTFAAVSVTPHLYRGNLGGAFAFVAGGQPGTVDGTGAAAGFTSIDAVAGDGQGGFYVADATTIRRVTPARVVTTVAGVPGAFGTADGQAGVGRLGRVRSMVFDAAAQKLYFADQGRIRVMTPDGTLSTLAGGGAGDGSGTQAGFESPHALLLGSDGALRLLDGGAVRRVSPTGEVQTIAGRVAARGLPVDGPPAVAILSSPSHLTFAPDGTIYVVDSGTVRRIAADGSVSTLAGAPLSQIPIDVGRRLAASNGWVAMGATDIAAPLRSSMPASGAVWVTSAAGAVPGETWPALPPEGTVGFGAAVAFSGDLLLSSQRSRDGVTGQPVIALRFAGDRWLPAYELSPAAGLSALASFGTALDGSDRFVAVGAPGPSLAAVGSVTVFDLDGLDSDGDGLPDQWETQYGFDPAVATGADGPDGDADGDGATNAVEYAAQTHPRNVASATRYFAEGARTSFFASEFAIANPGATSASVLLRYAAADGTVASTSLTVPARQRRTVPVPVGEVSEFATRVESDAPVVVDRVMSWDTDLGYGSHGEHALESAATTWYFAEGATHSGFDLFYLLYNPGPTAAQVRVRYLRAAGAPLEKVYEVGPNQRFNIWVDLEEFGGQPLLAAADVSARIEVENGVPIIAERAMYRSTPGAAPGTPGAVFAAGHESAGITAPSASWFFAEGAANEFFDLFVLMANPADQPSTVRARYLSSTGQTFTKDYVVAGNSRFNIWVDQETFDGVAGTPLANVGAVSTTLEVIAGPPIVAERAMWWPGPTPATWTEAHNSPGATTTAARWVAAAGEVTAGPDGADTYYLLANPGDVAADVTVTLLYEDGTAEQAQAYAVAARSRFTVDVRRAFPQAVGKRFSAVVTTAPTTPIVVEWSLYRDALGQFWGAGANALATPVP